MSADEPIDTGFGDVLAGNVWSEPAPVPVGGSIDYHLDQSFDAIMAASKQVTATVNPEPPQPAPEPSPTVTDGLTPAGVQAAKALVHLPPLTWPDLAKLAREMAMNIKERTVILQEFKLSETQYDFLETYNEFYREAYKAACKEWNAPLSTQQRIEVEAAAILEDSLLILGARMQNKGEGLPGVIEAAKFFGKVARVGERETGPSAPGERFSINIDLGGDKKLTVTATAPAPPDAGQPPSLTFSDDGKAS